MDATETRHSGSSTDREPPENRAEVLLTPRAVLLMASGWIASGWIAAAGIAGMWFTAEWKTATQNRGSEVMSQIVRPDQSTSALPTYSDQVATASHSKSRTVTAKAMAELMEAYGPRPRINSNTETPETAAASNPLSTDALREAVKASLPDADEVTVESWVEQLSGLDKVAVREILEARTRIGSTAPKSSASSPSSGVPTPITPQSLDTALNSIDPAPPAVPEPAESIDLSAPESLEFSPRPPD